MSTAASTEKGAAATVGLAEIAARAADPAVQDLAAVELHHVFERGVDMSSHKSEWTVRAWIGASHVGLCLSMKRSVSLDKWPRLSKRLTSWEVSMAVCVWDR